MIWTPSVPVHSTSGFKIPLILAATALTHVAYTPPNPPPLAHEASKYNEDKLTVLAPRTTLLLSKTAYWVFASCESAVIIATAFPSPASTVILSWLVRPGYSAAAVRPTTTTITGWVLLCIGGVIRIACYRALGRFFTFQLSIKEDHQLVTTGPYSIVRHPSYSAALFVLCGTLLSVFSKGSWCREAGWLDTIGGRILAAAWVAYTVPILVMVCVVRVKQEDAALQKQFSQEWERYAQKTPYRLVPFIY
ncbi:hypothetical protein BDW22DRAFT_1339274 [Trametopsis cervina]|nr:hypothetical protein BDW22DRAFT_1339274 [Trametopsis cervina]